ncbi:hypothetical protein ACFQ46_01570 [Kineococcus sp. GCM10028916]|uniref:hypothetical protein n=1 Tax=Kineococcus sp. GCM10028916 TaxID=3273394 RepID=UPI003643FA91
MSRGGGVPPGPYPGRRAVLRAAPLAAVAAVLSLTACREDDAGDASPASPAVPARAGGGPPAPDVRGWTPLPAAPLQVPVLRAGQAAVWTGSQVLVWGGCTPFRDGCALALTGDGAAWTPGADGAGSWDVLAPAPVAARAQARLWWTGSCAVLVGGLDPWAACEARPAGFLDVASFTPSPTGPGTWTRRPDLPWPVGTTVDASVWAGGAEGGATGQLFAWSATAGAWSLGLGDSSWTRLPEPPWTPPAAPLSWSAVESWWTGSEWLVMGHVSTGEALVVGLAFDPARSVWRTLDPGPLAGPAVRAVWTGERLLTFDVEAGVSSYDPVVDRWTAAPSGPLDEICTWSPQGGPALAWTGAELLVWGGARRGRDTGMCIDGNGRDDPEFAYGGRCNPATGPLGAAFDPAAGTWRTVPDGPWQRRGGATAVWTGESVFLAGGVDLEATRTGQLPPFPDHPEQAFVLFTPARA